MLLAIDIGNTQTAIGLFDDNVLLVTDREPTLHCSAGDASDFLAPRFVLWLEGTAYFIDSIIIASVVPGLNDMWSTYCQETYGVVPTFVSADLMLPIQLAVDAPATLGADRIANAIAARALYGAPSIVVDFGTATNLDVLDSVGRFVGGPIAPGLEVSATALFTYAARLGTIELTPPTDAVGRDTRSALRAGLYYGEAAKADGLVTRVRAQLDLPEVTPIIVTGGLATTLAPLMVTATATDPHLTLRGLRIIAIP